MRNAVRRTGDTDPRLLVILLLLAGMVLVQTFDALRISILLGRIVGDHPISVERVSDEWQAQRHSLPKALGTATIVDAILVDAVAPPSGVSGLEMQLLHGARAVTETPLPTLELAEVARTAPQTLEGYDLVGRWRLLLVDGSATTLLAYRDGPSPRDRVLIDARLVPEAGLVPEASGPQDLGAEPRRTRPRPDRTLLRDVVVESAILGALLLVGGLLLPAHPRLRPVRAPLGLIVGVAALATTGLLLVPGSSSLLVVGATASAAAFLARRRGHVVGWRRGDVRWLVVHVVLLFMTVVAARGRGFLSTSGDSFAYLLGARALALGQLDPSQLDVKRLIAQQALHAPGFAAGVEGLQSLGPVLLVAGMSVIALLPVVAEIRHRALLLALAAAAAGLVLSSGWMWLMASYINSHLLVAVMLLGLVFLWWFTAVHPGTERAVILPVSLMIATIILSRAEAILIVGLLLAGTLVSREELRWRWSWHAAGGLLLAWNALLAAGGGGIGGLSAPALIGLAGGGLLLLVPVTLDRIPAGVRGVLPNVLLGLLWAATAGYLLIEVTGARPVTFFGALRANLGLGAGGWGVTAPFLLIVGLFAVWNSRAMPAAAPARTLVIGFLPITLLAKMADGSDRVDADALFDVTGTLLTGGGRVGWGDSGNRMLTHVTLVIVFLFVVALLQMGQQEQEDPDASASPRTRPVRSPRAIVALMTILAFAILTIWDPQNLGWPGPALTTQVLSAETGHARLTLSDGAVLQERIDLPEDLLPSDAASALVCAELLIANPGGTREGALDLEIEVDGTVGRQRSTADATLGDILASVCVEFDGEVSLEGPAVVTVTGHGGAEQSGVDVSLVRPSASDVSNSQRFVLDLTVDFDAPSTDPRPRAVRLVSVVMRRTLLESPNVALILAAAATVIPRRRSHAIASGRSGS